MVDFEYAKEYLKLLEHLEKKYDIKANKFPEGIQRRMYKSLSALMVTEQETVLNDLDEEHTDEITDFLEDYKERLSMRN